MDLNRLRILSGLEPINESEELNEVAPTDQEDFVKDAKAEFKKRYGKRWKEVLYATAWKKHKNEAAEDHFATADAIANLLEMQEISGIKEEMSFAGDKKTYFVYGRCERKSAKVTAADMYKAVKAFAGKDVQKTSGNPVLSSQSNPVNFIDSDGNACEYVSYQLTNESVDFDSVQTLLENNFTDAKRLADRGRGDNPAKTGNHDSEFPETDDVKVNDTGIDDVTDVEFNDDKVAFNNVMTGQDIEQGTKIDVPSYVTTAIDKRIKELESSIDRWDEKGYNQYGAIYKNAKHNALDLLAKFKELLAMKDESAFKEAQTLYGTLSSPIFDLLPAQLVKFLHNGHDEPKKKI